jgi:hypothetical protein
MNATAIRSLKEGKPIKSDSLDIKTLQLFGKLFQTLGWLEPSGPEEYRSVWIGMEGGSTAERSLESEWFLLATSKFKDTLSFFLDRRLIAEIPADPDPASLSDDFPGPLPEVLAYLNQRAGEEISRIASDPYAYQAHLEEVLPPVKRFGRIRRRDYWESMGDNIHRPDLALGEETIDSLTTLVNMYRGREEWASIRELTADEFFHFAAVCYDGAGFFEGDDKDLTTREKYWQLSDGRHEGMLNILGDSPGEFTYWYRSGGGTAQHPWEICRGGEKPPIALHPRETDMGWRVTLKGPIPERLEEMVRMAVALHEEGIPFILRDADEILKMVRGEDYIGIVPEDIDPVWCHSYFPDEDRVVEFMNLPEGKREEIIARMQWYPQTVNRIAL